MNIDMIYETAYTIENLSAFAAILIELILFNSGCVLFWSHRMFRMAENTYEDSIKRTR